MNAPSRRYALGTFLGFGLSIAFAPSLAKAQDRLPVPGRPLKLSRRFERSLLDGEQIRVDRTWRVTFLRQGQGIAISGVQIGVKVECPPSLAQLALIEEARSTEEMWPILLDQNGLILAAGGGVNPQDISAAIEVAQQMLSRDRSGQPSQAVQARFLADLQKAGTSLLEQLPEDLFYPRVGPVRAVRSVELPDGSTGEFEVSYDAQASPETGWLARAERQVISRIGSSERMAREVWQLGEL